MPGATAPRRCCPWYSDRPHATYLHVSDQWNWRVANAMLQLGSAQGVRSAVKAAFVVQHAVIKHCERSIQYIRVATIHCHQCGAVIPRLSSAHRGVGSGSGCDRLRTRPGSSSNSCCKSGGWFSLAGCQPVSTTACTRKHACRVQASPRDETWHVEQDPPGARHLVDGACGPPQRLAASKSVALSQRHRLCMVG